MSKAFFVTGTDTGVGKTFITSALLHACAGRGLKAVGMKPVVAGCERVAGRVRWEDVEILMAASNVAADAHLVNPFSLEPAIAPHIAAEQAGIEISLKPILEAFGGLRSRAEVVFVEGVGGFRVPLGPRLDTADVAQGLGLPVILVVGMRLGCLNHALLTQEAIAARGLRLAGWVANCIDPAMAALDENVEALRTRLDAPLIGVVPWWGGAEPAEVAPKLEITRIV